MVACKNQENYILKEESQLNDICLNAHDCFIKASFNTSHRLIKKMFMKNIDCQCVDHYDFQCGSKFCTVSQEACDKLKANAKIYDESFISSIKGCNNGNTAKKIRPFNFKLRF